MIAVIRWSLSSFEWSSAKRCLWSKWKKLHI